MSLVMSDEELLDALDPEHPDLAAVREARETGGAAAAKDGAGAVHPPARRGR